VEVALLKGCLNFIVK